ncbi:PspA/IM30 family protein [Planctomicrobium sp. SH527]|uniref:PspA/IM30 family protein n=1 Tax=Planctomicrobium sp. SH527 TaxID=3448123 RepID=UPI003F5C1A9F
MRSNLTYLREKVENPERMLHQLIIDMEEELESVRKSVAMAIADEVLLKKRTIAARQEIDQWMDRAQRAVERNNESAAKAALEQKGLASERAEQLESEHIKQQEQTEKLRRSVSELEDKVRQARQKRTLLLARLNRAESAQKINTALDRAAGASAFAEFGRLESRVEHAEALAEAYERLDGRDPDADDLERQFVKEERQAKIEQELQSLKDRIQTR